ncbi:MAG: phenylacetate-CoA oxygenase subunit PaaC [Acidimicrobiia bacterium]|nr:phenylacetate-CoA oxygenase subunit PaaC [Acidimicrobiia bacterium]
MSRLHEYLIRLADDNLILSQRLSEYISRAPELEEDLAVANIALDHLGVAMHLLSYAAEVQGDGRTADDLAFLRSEREYTNVLLVEQPNVDFAHIIARQFLFDAYQTGLWQALAASNDETLAGVAAKAAKEAAYHLRHSSGWMIRLGDGTAESHDRAQAALATLWRFVDELFAGDDLDAEMAATGYGVAPEELRSEWDHRVDSTLTAATLQRSEDGYQRSGGRNGFHTEQLGHLLGEMQWMQRSYPGLQW